MIRNMANMRDFPRDLKRQVDALTKTLIVLSADPEQEITANAATVFDSVVDMAREAFPDHRTISVVLGPAEVELTSGSPIRVADALLVVGQIDAIIGPWPAAVA